MARLTLDAGGEERRFRLNEGKLTIGSGESCTLRIDDDGIAEVHAELEFDGKNAMLRMRRGVAPGTVQGRPVASEHSMAHGVPVQLGGARLTVEFEGQEKQTLVERRHKTTRAEAAGARRGSAGSAGARERSSSRRPRQRSSGGIPTWLIIVGVVIAGGIAWRMTVGVVGQTGGMKFSPAAAHARVQRIFQDRGSKPALEELDRVNVEELTPEWKQKFAALRQEVAGARELAEQRGVNQKGTQYLETQLKRFESDYLKKNEPPRVRVFLMRLAHFLETWPDHPEADWARRMQTRYAKIVDLSDEPTFADIEFEVKTLTWAKPRDYTKAFAVLDTFIESCSGDDFELTKNLIDTKEKERDEYFLDRLQEAKHQREKREDDGKAIFWLVSMIGTLGDADMENQTADILLAFPKIEETLGGYKKHYPDIFERLMTNEKVANVARDAGL